MYCKNCGQRLGDEAAFCKQCGTPVTRRKGASNPAAAILEAPSSVEKREETPAGSGEAATTATHPSSGIGSIQAPIPNSPEVTGARETPEGNGAAALSDAPGVGMAVEPTAHPRTRVAGRDRGARYGMLIPLVVNAFIAVNTIVLYLAKLPMSSTLFAYYSPAGTFAAYALFTVIPTIILIPAIWGLADGASVVTNYRKPTDRLLARDIALSFVLLVVFIILLIARAVFGTPVYDEAGSLMYWTSLQYYPMAVTYLIPDIVMIVALFLIRSYTGKATTAPRIPAKDS